MHLIEAMNRRQTRITLFIHYWMDSRGPRHGPAEAAFPMDLTETEWEHKFDNWEHNILTDELLEAHCADYVPPTEIKESS